MLLFAQLCCISINCQKDLCLLDNEQNLGPRKFNASFIMYLQSQCFIKTKPKKIVVYRLDFPKSIHHLTFITLFWLEMNELYAKMLL